MISGMVILIKWRVYKTTKNSMRARNNLMNFHNWSKAIEYIAEKIGADYPKQIKKRLSWLEAEEFFSVERRR